MWAIGDDRSARRNPGGHGFRFNRRVSMAAMTEQPDQKVTEVD
jgi:hypothetical protein